ncbi:MAG: helix-turn-helix transcriptional regulator [Pacificimonas sp.]|jgi:transcriptional regulator with XRE-family HTH domain|nr:helix-turn-helix transcriptional regulator [Pacificimonas sp.]
MMTNIREVRQGKSLTLAEVAERCDPPTTPQTIGRLETGARTVSIDWLNRIAAALGVLPSDLVRSEDRAEVDVAARLTASGAEPLRRRRALAAPHPSGEMLGMIVEFPHGEYRPGDELWLEQLTPDRFREAANRDVLAPRPAGRFAFGRLVDLYDNRISILPLRQGSRQTVLTDTPWLAVVKVLIREL